jgi:hypothetical protein
MHPHKGTFHCCSFCSSGGSKEATCGCGGKMPGETIMNWSSLFIFINWCSELLSWNFVVHNKTRKVYSLEYTESPEEFFMTSAVCFFWKPWPKGTVDLHHSYAKGIENSTILSKATMVYEIMWSEVIVVSQQWPQFPLFWKCVALLQQYVNNAFGSHYCNSVFQQWPWFQLLKLFVSLKCYSIL